MTVCENILISQKKTLHREAEWLDPKYSRPWLWMTPDVMTDHLPVSWVEMMFLFWDWNHVWGWCPRAHSGWSIKQAPTHCPCSGPELQAGGSKARCKYIQDAYKYWQLRPHLAAARVTCGHVLFNNVVSESHIKERNHPLQRRRCWFIIIIQEMDTNCKNIMTLC